MWKNYIDMTKKSMFPFPAFFVSTHTRFISECPISRVGESDKTWQKRAKLCSKEQSTEW